MTGASIGAVTMDGVGAKLANIVITTIITKPVSAPFASPGQAALSFLLNRKRPRPRWSFPF
jgi:hypothetical protein